MNDFEHEHSPQAIAQRIASVKHNYVRDWIYGGIDGAVTTFAVVSGVAGAGLEPVIVLILGFANLVADGFSMAASNFLGTRAELDDFKRLEKIEYRHIEQFPEGEREEIRQIFKDKGFEGDELERAVDLITSDKDRWVRTMLTEEYGLPSEIRSPWRAAFATFSAFIICGFIPLVPYVFGVHHLRLYSARSLRLRRRQKLFYDLIGPNRRDIFYHRLAKKPLVNFRLAAFGIGNVSCRRVGGGFGLYRWGFAERNCRIDDAYRNTYWLDSRN